MGVRAQKQACAHIERYLDVISRHADTWKMTSPIFSPPPFSSFYPAHVQFTIKNIHMSLSLSLEEGSSVYVPKEVPQHLRKGFLIASINKKILLLN